MTPTHANMVRAANSASDSCSRVKNAWAGGHVILIHQPIKLCQGPCKKEKSVAAQVLKLTPKYLKLGFYCIFTLQFLIASGCTHATAPTVTGPLRQENSYFMNEITNRET